MTGTRNTQRRQAGARQRAKHAYGDAPSTAAEGNDLTQVISMQAHLDLVHALIEKLTDERDAAYQNGWTDAEATFGMAA